MKYYHARRRKKILPRRLLWIVLAIELIMLVIGGFALAKKYSPVASQAPVVALEKTTPPAAPVAPVAAAVVSPPAHSYGIAAGGSLGSLDSTALNARLDGIKATGASWIRFDFSWTNIQPDSRNSYNWDAYDRVVTASTQRGLKVLGIITYTPTWARSPACRDQFQCQPANPTDFATFAAAVAQRYSPKGVHAWEIWNEPNNPDFFQPKANPALYTTMLQQTDVAIKRKDPSATVLTGGLSPQATTSNSLAPIDFLSALYKDGAKGYFDAVSDHPYTFPLSPLSTEDHAWNQMAAADHSLRSTMVQYGDTSKKIWLTEFGAPTGGPGPIATIANPNTANQPYAVDDGLQAKILSDGIALYNSYDWVGPFFWYSYQDAGTSKSTNENFFGLLRYEGSKKPAYAIYQQAALSAR